MAAGIRVLVAALVAALVALCGAAAAHPNRQLVPEIIDMGVTGRRSAGPGPAGAAGEGTGGESHPRLTLAITPAPTANHYQHVQGGFVSSEPAASQPRSEDDLQSGFSRRRRQARQALLDQEAEASSGDPVRTEDSDAYLEQDATPVAVSTEEPAGQPQNLFPAFQPLFPLGHSRPPIFQQEPAYSQRQALLRPQYNAFHPLDIQGAFRERAFPQAAAPPEIHSNALLGSGNFGVIHGGTFYGEDKEDDYDSPSLQHSFYSGNGHGRPAFYRGNPEPQRYRTAEDFFANFRDFADISTPTKSSFSEFYVVYVNRNASKDDAGTVVGPDATAATAMPRAPRPNNIMERLAEIDREHTAEHTAEQPKKKLSLGKRKLALIKKTKKSASSASREVAVQRDAHEPLLALS